MLAAHISKDLKREQSVQEHCKNTAVLCMEYCALFGGENIGYLAGSLHDTGKLCTDFDSYIRGDTKFRRGEIDHSYAGARYITELAGHEYSDIARFIARVIISHHGLHDWIGDDCRDYFKQRVSNDKNYEQIKDNISKTATENDYLGHLQKADCEYKEIRRKIKKISRTQEEAAFYMGMLERLVESALIDADRTDTASFMTDTELPEFFSDPGSWQKMKRNMEQKLNGFADKTDVISVQRRSISARCESFASENVKICKLIVPTGGGKTLSSLRFAINYCIKHGMEKIVYTAPFMSILEQNSAEIRSIAEDDNFLEHHSNAIAEKADNSEELSDYELHTERWDKPVIATTMIQLLNSMFLGKTSSVRRFHRIAKSVIIIDEIQSLPLKCVNMFDLAINFLAYICGSAIVLCTATQPSTEDVPHPVILDKAESITGDYSADFEVFKRTEIIPVITPYGYSYEEASDFCMDKFAEAGNLLVIVNTKSAALKLYRLLKERCGSEAEVLHLSTNMCPQHRREKIEYIRSMLDKKPVICVTTQLIEAGVDISFKCVVRSLAGLDSAVQAAGRCNRHGENNEICPVYLIKLKEERLGNLREISKAQGITQMMTESGRYNDLSSPAAVSDYFRKLYLDEKNALSYSVPENETLLNYLALNKKRYEASPQTSCKYESQAFKTAGTLFRVIDDNTQDVIVPYNDKAIEIIQELERNEGSLSELLRKAQRYTVSIYNGTERRLYENNALRKIANDVIILDKTYYSNEFGIDINGAENELLIF